MMTKYIVKQKAISALINEANTHSNPMKRAYTRAAAIIEQITAEDAQPIKRWMTMLESELYWIDPTRALPRYNHSDVIVLYNDTCYIAVFVRNENDGVFVIKCNECPYTKQSTDVQGWLPIPNKENIR